MEVLKGNLVSPFNLNHVFFSFLNIYVFLLCFLPSLFDSKGLSLIALYTPEFDKNSWPHLKAVGG